MKTVDYVRVSTDRQAERGISLEAQAKEIRAMALVQGAELSEIIVESGESAKSLNRPGVAKLDRLTRSVKDLRELLERLEVSISNDPQNIASGWPTIRTEQERTTPILLL